ncbi:MAG TPA: hypothetical protein VKT72_01615, partial [Candidatus Baltobacteraceae bacterium]|nr:hypothetical protein [Candidatus Baltobacteraceae bacterium]
MQSANVAAPAYYAVALPNGFVPFAIMKDGQIPGAVGNQAAIDNNGIVTLLASDPNCVSGTTAAAVNTLGQAVGFCFKNARRGERIALDFANGTVRELGDRFRPGIAEALTINDAGEIYGTSTCLNCSAAPFLTEFFTNGQRPRVLGESNSTGNAENVFLSNTGHFAYTNFPFAGPEFAAIGYGWGLSRLFPNQVGNSGVSGINDHDTTVGWKSAGSFNHFQTFIRSPGGGITFLPSPLGITSMTPTGINNAGQVVGQSCSARCDGIFFYSSGDVVDLTWRISPRNSYTLLGGLSDSGDFIGQDPQGNSYLIEPVKPLFVANYFANTVTAYVPPYTGSPISTTSFYIGNPQGLAFDGKRDLFVSNGVNSDIT